MSLESSKSFSVDVDVSTLRVKRRGVPREQLLVRGMRQILTPRHESKSRWLTDKNTDLMPYKRLLEGESFDEDSLLSGLQHLFSEYNPKVVQQMAHVRLSLNRLDREFGLGLLSVNLSPLNRKGEDIPMEELTGGTRKNLTRVQNRPPTVGLSVAPYSFSPFADVGFRPTQGTTEAVTVVGGQFRSGVYSHKNHPGLWKLAPQGLDTTHFVADNQIIALRLSVSMDNFQSSLPHRSLVGAFAFSPGMYICRYFDQSTLSLEKGKEPKDWVPWGRAA